MRRVDHIRDFATEVAAAEAGADSAFGDSSVLLEKYILNPRHLEVQLAGDRTGGLVHLFERDCSVQRNNQKVLEEAPAPLRALSGCCAAPNSRVRTGAPGRRCGRRRAAP